jgi:hypothetical protein
MSTSESTCVEGAPVALERRESLWGDQRPVWVPVRGPLFPRGWPYHRWWTRQVTVFGDGRSEVRWAFRPDLYREDIYG